MNTSPPSTAQIPVVEYIDCTPTWEAVLPIYIECLQDANPDREKTAAIEEMLRMARAADRWNQHCKEMKGE